MRSRSSKGFTIVEALIASSVALIVILGVTSAFTLTLSASTGTVNRVQASFLQEEGQEAIRLMRDDSWTTNIAGQTAGTPFYLTYSGATWKATSTPQYIDGKFLRTVTLDTVSRNGSSDIVTSGGTVDSNTMKVTVAVSWYDHGATTTRSLQTYLTNIFSN
jgi:Tfp pilus assembly protein PilV